MAALNLDHAAPSFFFGIICSASNSKGHTSTACTATNRSVARETGRCTGPENPSIQALLFALVVVGVKDCGGGFSGASFRGGGGCIYVNVCCSVMVVGPASLQNRDGAYRDFAGQAVSFTRMI